MDPTFVISILLPFYYVLFFYLSILLYLYINIYNIYNNNIYLECRQEIVNIRSTKQKVVIMAKAPKRTKITRADKEKAFEVRRVNDEWWETFFHKLSETGHIKACLDQEGIPYRTYYEWINKNPERKKQQQQALQEFSYKLASMIRGNAEALDQRNADDPDPKKAQVAIQTYQWLASKVNPDQFGDRQRVDVQTRDLTEEHRQAIKRLADQGRLREINPRKHIEDQSSSRGGSDTEDEG